MEKHQKKQQALSLVIAGLIILLGVLVGWYFLSARGTHFVKYENKFEGFTVKYPRNWTFDESNKGVACIFYSPLENELDVFKESVNVVVQNVAATPMSLEEYTETAIHQMEAVFKDNLEILESSPVTFAKREGHKFVFLGKGEEDNDFKFRIYWTLDGTTAYQITYMAKPQNFEKYSQIAEKMAKSFRIRQR